GELNDLRNMEEPPENLPELMRSLQEKVNELGQKIEEIEKKKTEEKEEKEKKKREEEEEGKKEQKKKGTEKEKKKFEKLVKEQLQPKIGLAPEAEARVISKSAKDLQKELSNMKLPKGEEERFGKYADNIIKDTNKAQELLSKKDFEGARKILDQAKADAQKLVESAKTLEKLEKAKAPKEIVEAVKKAPELVAAKESERADLALKAGKIYLEKKETLQKPEAQDVVGRLREFANDVVDRTKKVMAQTLDDIGKQIDGIAAKL